MSQGRHPGWTEKGHAWLDAGAPTTPRTEQQIREKAIRECMDALLDDGSLAGAMFGKARSRIEALLPKPDPAKALVEEWAKLAVHPTLYSRDAECEKFARWLISQDRIKL